MLLTLIRHGEVAGRAQVLRGRSDPALSAQGHVQMQQIVDIIQPAISLVVTSPLQRCHLFAETYCEQQNLPLHINNDLREIDFGDWEELTLAEAQIHDPACYEQFQHDTLQWQAPNGEAYAAFRIRVRAALEQMRAMNTHTLAITHGGVIRAILAECLQLSPASAAHIGIPLAGMCQLWLDEHGTGSLLRLQWLEPHCAGS